MVRLIECNHTINMLYHSGFNGIPIELYMKEAISDLRETVIGSKSYYNARVSGS